MKITKILAPEATPAKTILDRAAHIALTSEQRAHLPNEVTVNGQSIEVSIENARALEVGDALLDETGHFYVVEAAPEPILVIKAEEEMAAEAAVALINRGIRVAKVDDGFAVLKDIALVKMLSSVGLQFEEKELPFDPIRPQKHKHHADGGCCCGHHHHHHEDGECCCGGEGHHHHHHHEEGECCCGGEGHHHHHHDEGECCCGGEGHHHHHHEEGECCCGGEGHHHHHHEEGECCCGGEGHHHHHEEGECCCGGEGHHHHHHEEGECCCNDHSGSAKSDSSKSE